MWAPVGSTALRLVQPKLGQSTGVLQGARPANISWSCTGTAQAPARASQPRAFRLETLEGWRATRMGRRHESAAMAAFSKPVPSDNISFDPSGPWNSRTKGSAERISRGIASHSVPPGWVRRARTQQAKRCLANGPREAILVQPFARHQFWYVDLDARGPSDLFSEDGLQETMNLVPRDLFSKTSATQNVVTYL